MKDRTATGANYGPWLVGLGAALWGTESAWRIPLNELFDAEVIVFWEHVLILLMFLPLLLPSLGELRKIKSPTEIAHLRKAIALTADAQAEVIKLLAPGVPEYRLEGAILGAFISGGGMRAGFPSIVPRPIDGHAWFPGHGPTCGLSQ